jgi:hypothetical protein
MGDNTVYYYNEKLLVKGNESDDYKCAQMEELTFGTAWDSKWKSFVIQGHEVRMKKAMTARDLIASIIHVGKR